MNFQTRTNDSGFNLFLFPFAGGSSASYMAFLRLLSPGINAFPMDYPGRGKRLAEPLLDNVNQVVDDMFNELRHRLSSPYAFYGHSMGALISFLLARRIVQENYPAPVSLFLSGRGGPKAPVKKELYYQLPRAGFVDKLRTLGGCPDEMLDNPEMLEFFEPILRADFKAVETYQHTSAPPLNIPFHVMYGDKEEKVAAAVHLWENETTRPLQTTCFSGNHFFIYQHIPEITGMINRQLLPFL